MRSVRKIALGLVSIALTSGFLAACSGDTVSYRPPVATTFDRADCLAPDIDRRLTASAYDGVETGPRAEGIGYPPADFTPVAVVRCERGENSSGALTIDSVRLEGDVAAAWDAFRDESERFSGNSTASCIRQASSPGVWFVDGDGRAVRPSWPATPCGPKDGPITALSTLHEVERQQHSTGRWADDPGVCGTKFGSGFSTTADADVLSVAGTDPRERISENFALAFPIDDVGRLQVCRYGEQEGEWIQESGSRLTAEQSVAVVRAVVTAPPAPACSLAATRTAVIPLYRADRSGGAEIEIELDGCTRATAMGLGQVAVPDSVFAVVDAGTQ